MATTKVDVNLIGATGTPGSGNFLRGDGTWNTPAAGALTFISSTDISNAATYDFTAVDASKYDSYMIVTMNVNYFLDFLLNQLKHPLLNFLFLSFHFL